MKSWGPGWDQRASALEMEGEGEQLGKRGEKVTTQPLEIGQGFEWTAKRGGGAQGAQKRGECNCSNPAFNWGRKTETGRVGSDTTWGEDLNKLDGTRKGPPREGHQNHGSQKDVQMEKKWNVPEDNEKKRKKEGEKSG